MTINDIKNYYGTGYRFSKLTGMRHTNFINWQKRGFVPINTQIKLETLTNGVLKANLGHLNENQDDEEIQFFIQTMDKETIDDTFAQLEELLRNINHEPKVNLKVTKAIAQCLFAIKNELKKQ